MWNLISIIIGGLGIGSLITFFVTRYDNKKNLEGKLHKIEKDSVRTQILLLMYNYHEADQKELLDCAEYYFKKENEGGLDGDWYLSAMFKRFLDSHEIDIPSWFVEKK